MSVMMQGDHECAWVTMSVPGPGDHECYDAG